MLIFECNSKHFQICLPIPRKFLFISGSGFGLGGSVIGSTELVTGAFVLGASVFGASVFGFCVVFGTSVPGGGDGAFVDG